MTDGRTQPGWRHFARISRGVALIALLATAACDSTAENEFPLEGTILSVSDIEGTWQATEAVFSRAAAGPEAAVDIVAAGGSATLSIQSNGRFSLVMTESGAGSETTTGQIGFDEDILAVVYDDDPEGFEYYGISATATTLTIQGYGGEFEYDFVGDGSVEAANLYLSFVRP